MCGIAGIWTVSGPAEARRAIEAMTASMMHRGPDDGGVEVFPVAASWAGLGGRRLAIQDLSSAGHQPMQDRRTGNWIVFNGEIYNFHSLRDELQRRGVSFESNGDTEVVLKGYAAWGVGILRRLRGMFAFAIWDAGAQQLVLARDRLGVKPLYYHATAPGSLLFASEVRTILASGLVSRRLADEGLLSYLALGAVQDPLTLVADVLAVPAGNYGIWQGRHLALHEYWSLRDCYRPGTPSGVDQRELPALVRTELAASVSARLISDAPVGVFLSGGLDSSAITALAASQDTSRVRTVSVVFREARYSEEDYIRLVVRRYGTDHVQVCLTSKDFLDVVPTAIGAMDQPTFDGINTFVVSQQARRAGLTVALSGIGGDELFGGYASFRRVPRLHVMRQWVPAFARRPAGLLVRQGQNSDQARKLARWLDGTDLDGPAELLARELFGPSDRRRLTRELTSPWAPALELFQPPLDSDDFNRVSFFELSYYLKNVLLRDTDCMSMAHSLEVREPLLDHRLVELVAGLAGKVKRNGGQPKALLVEALREDLPEELLTRPKQGFVLPFTEWLRGPLRATVEQALLDDRLGGQVSTRLDPASVKRAWSNFLDGTGTWVRPWSLFVLKLWGERWL